MSVTAVVAVNHLGSSVLAPPQVFATPELGLESSDFELFQIPSQAAIQPEILAERWRALQARTHPDRFATQGESAVRVAMQYSVRVNEAYQRLRAPDTRFGYLCELHGVAINAQTNTVMPSEFLMQQMHWREALEQAHELAQVEQISAEVLQFKAQIEDECVAAIDVKKDFQHAASLVRCLMFLKKLQTDIDKKIDQLES